VAQAYHNLNPHNRHYAVRQAEVLREGIRDRA